ARPARTPPPIRPGMCKTRIPPTRSVPTTPTLPAAARHPRTRPRVARTSAPTPPSTPARRRRGRTTPAAARSRPSRRVQSASLARLRERGTATAVGEGGHELDGALRRVAEKDSQEYAAAPFRRLTGATFPRKREK